MKKEKNITRFLEALQWVYVLIRFDPKDSVYHNLLRIFDKYLIEDFYCDEMIFNHFRNEICVLEAFDSKTHLLKTLEKFWLKKKIKNVKLFKNDILLLKKINEEIFSLLDAGKYDQVKDLTDAVHNFPEMLIKSDVWKASDFWKVFIIPYRRDWDSEFLKAWEGRFS